MPLHFELAKALLNFIKARGVIQFELFSAIFILLQVRQEQQGPKRQSVERNFQREHLLQDIWHLLHAQGKGVPQQYFGGIVVTILHHIHQVYNVYIFVATRLFR